MVDAQTGSRNSDFPFRDTAAAMMLKSGLDRQKARGISLRSIAKKLEYKQPTVLSHMAHGRVAIPIERASEIAREVGIDQREFLAAAVAQRAPEAHDVFGQAGAGSFGLAAEVALIAGGPLDQLSDEQKSVIREVAADPKAARRWLSVAELQAVTLIRKARPDFRERGLSLAEMNFLESLFDLEP